MYTRDVSTRCNRLIDSLYINYFNFFVVLKHYLLTVSSEKLIV